MNLSDNEYSMEGQKSSQTKGKTGRRMELALVVSIISVCGFAGALSYNVYEFRKVGKALDRVSERLELGRKEHEGMIKTLELINEA